MRQEKLTAAARRLPRTKVAEIARAADVPPDTLHSLRKGNRIPNSEARRLAAILGIDIKNGKRLPEQETA